MKESIIASNIEMLELIEEFLKEGKSVRLRIKGTSMLPFLRDESEQVDLSMPADRELKKGSVVLFRYENGFILHRIIQRKGDQLIIRGDHIFQSKEYVTTDQVIGIVRKIIYPSGFILSTQSLQWKGLSSIWLCFKPVLRLIYQLKAFIPKGV